MTATNAARPSLPIRVRIPKPLQAYLWWQWTIPYVDWCRRRYGDRFTVFAPPWGDVAILADPNDIKTMFTSDPEVVHAGEAIQKIFGRLMGERSLFVLDEDEHLRARKLLLPPFHGASVRRYSELMSQLAAEEVDSWPVGEKIRLHPAMQRITLEIILRDVFGVTDPERLSILRSELPRIVNPGPVLVMAWALPQLDRFGPWKRYWKRVAETHALLDDEVARRRRDPDLEQRTDVLSQMILARDGQGRALSDADLRDELMTLLLAGHDTTATGLAWTFERLMRHPAVLQRLRAELAEGSEEYLEAVVKEALRVRPVVVGALRKLTADVEITGHRLPAGVHVVPCSTAVQRSPRRWESPLEFRPERFLGKNPPPYTLIPFGGGVRRCLGASFAMVEMKAVVKTVLERVELVTPRAAPEAQKNKQVTQTAHRGAEAIITRRLVPPGTPPNGSGEGGAGVLAGTSAGAADPNQASCPRFRPAGR